MGRWNRQDAKGAKDAGVSGAGETAAAFGGEAVFLEAAGGFVGDGAFDASRFERGQEIGFPEVLAIREI
jgi:hypothetical protein